MDIFNLNTKKKHIELFELKVAELLKDQYPQLRNVIGKSKLYGISFIHAPKGIYLSRGYKPEAYNEFQRTHRTHFNLFGISAYHFKEQSFNPLKLNYSFDSLTRIDVEEPERFHKNFDLERLQLGEIVIEELSNENPDKDIVTRILKTLTKEQIQTLELDDTFELEFDEKLYYTILDMEDGNYIAVDKSGHVYRMNHDHQQQIRKIANKPTEFFSFYHGNKIDLEQIMEE